MTDWEEEEKTYFQSVGAAPDNEILDCAELNELDCANVGPLVGASAHLLSRF